MISHNRTVSTLAGAVIGTTLLLVTPLAQAEPEADVEVDAHAASPRLAPGLRLSLSVEPGLAMALTNPQSQRTDAGFGQTLNLLFGVTPYLALGPMAAFTTLPSAPSMATPETAWAFGGGARLMRPHDALGFYGASPWVDADLLYVRTGGFDRPGLATGVGLSVPLDGRRRFWIGPYGRYFQIVQSERSGFDNRDAKILELGIGLEVGAGLERRYARAQATVVEPVALLPAPPPDRDGDGVSDAADNCPDVAGLVENSGCPAYQKVVVQPDKLELKEKIAFAWDSALLGDTSRPVLDEVAQALKDNPSFRVQVDGHASSEGGDAHNQVLSEERASAVVDYLVARGVAGDRLSSKGFSSSVPATTNATAAGRVTNRRVEFVVDFIIIKEGNTR
jgi:outer membrane protein OmpA-like peptidoglycan-associated protein